MKRKIQNINVDEALNIIDTCIKYQVFSKQIAGIAVGIIHKNKVVYSKSLGYANQKEKRPITGKTTFRIASISKTFTATAIFQLIEGGKLKLCDTISTHLPWFHSSRDIRVGNITIAQLLSHTSGFTRDGDTPHWVDGNFPDIEYIKQYVVTCRLPITPGSRWKYSNFGYAILGALIQQVSGMSYEEYLQKNIFQKLGFTHTSTLEQKNGSYAVGYGRKVPGKTKLSFSWINANAFASATGIDSCFHDLLSYAHEQLSNEPVLISKQTIEVMRKTVWTKKNLLWGQSYGWKIWKRKTGYVYRHSGGFQGYMTEVAFNPTHELGIVILSNDMDTDTAQFVKLILNVFISLTQNKFPEGDFIQNNLSKLSGIYTSIWSEEGIIPHYKILLHFYPGGWEPMKGLSYLIPKGNNTFKIEGGYYVEKVGEEAHFTFNKRGGVKQMTYGGTPTTPFFPKIHEYNVQ